MTTKNENTVPVRSDAGKDNAPTIENRVYAAEEMTQALLDLAAWQMTGPEYREWKPVPADQHDMAFVRVGVGHSWRPVLLRTVPSDDVESKPIDPQPCPSCGGPPPDEYDPNDVVRRLPGRLSADVLWQCRCECGMAAPVCKSSRGAIAQWNMLSMTSSSMQATVIAALTTRIPGYRYQNEPRMAKALSILGHGGRYCPKASCFGYRCPDDDLLAGCVLNLGLAACPNFNREE